jgi:hypothetical protein
MTREAIYAAAFAFMTANVGSGVVSTSRRLKLWSDVTWSEQPAIFQAQVSEDSPIPPVKGLPYKWVLGVEWYVYVSSGDDNTMPPSTILNPILDSLEALFPHAGKPQTLGNLVEEIRIAGRIRIAEMSQGTQAVALVPIRIVVSSS